MSDNNFRDDIGQIEAQIEAQTVSIEQCRKISFAAKLTVAAGAVWFALVLLWIIPFDPTAFVAALTAVLGGVVLLGSNATTWDQTVTALHAAEATRAALIENMELRVVGEDMRTIH